MSRHRVGLALLAIMSCGRASGETGPAAAVHDTMRAMNAAHYCGFSLKASKAVDLIVDSGHDPKRKHEANYIASFYKAEEEKWQILYDSRLKRGSKFKELCNNVYNDLGLGKGLLEKK